METSAPPVLSNVTAVPTAPRPTPTPPRVQFSDVLASGASAIVQGAQAAATVLPGSPLLAVAIRGATPSWSVPGSSSANPFATGVSMSAGTVTTAPEGPGGATAGTTGTSSTGTDPSLESSMAQTQQQNLYYLQIQEQVNAQNRTFTALSNVIEVEHSTAKAAIGNIH